MNEKEKTSAALHCSAFGCLRPADICPECEDCGRNCEFENRGGLPAMLLTGSRENLAAAIRSPGVVMDDVAVVNAKHFEAMCDLLDQLNRLCFNMSGLVRMTRIQSEARELLKTVRGEK